MITTTSRSKSNRGGHSGREHSFGQMLDECSRMMSGAGDSPESSCEFHPGSMRSSFQPMDTTIARLVCQLEDLFGFTAGRTALN